VELREVIATITLFSWYFAGNTIYNFVV